MSPMVQGVINGSLVTNKGLTICNIFFFMNFLLEAFDCFLCLSDG